MIQNESPELAGTSGRGLEDSTHANHTAIPRPRKWARVLRAFLTGRSFNRFEAERELHDHCLHTTVAGLQFRGIVILRRVEVVPGFADCPTHVMRYALDRTPENISRAVALLNDKAPRSLDRAEGMGRAHPLQDNALVALP